MTILFFSEVKEIPFQAPSQTLLSIILESLGLLRHHHTGIPTWSVRRNPAPRIDRLPALSPLLSDVGRSYADEDADLRRRVGSRRSDGSDADECWHGKAKDAALIDGSTPTNMAKEKKGWNCSTSMVQGVCIFRDWQACFLYTRNTWFATLWDKALSNSWTSSLEWMS